MERKAVSGIMLTLLLIGMLTLAFNIQPVKASGTIYIRADGSVDPPTAPISTIDNVTYTFTDNIYDSIVVERDNIVVDGAGYTVHGTGAYSSTGVSLSGRSGVLIKNMNIREFWNGIWLYSSSSNRIFENKITNNHNAGVNLVYSSNNSISGNKITNPTTYGIWFYESSNNSILGNKITNNWAGIGFSESLNNNIARNNITENGFWSILLHWSSNNSVSGNNIANNYYGIYFFCSSQNPVYHNSVINNAIQVYSESSLNFWDDGYPSGGNYWSNYTGIDERSGSNQDQPGNDGIGDTPHIINVNNQDRYPLMHPWSSLPVHNINTGLGYATIQEAINANETLDGHKIFVEAGTYYENVVVNKTVLLIGENRDTTIIDGGGTGNVVYVEATEVNIRAFTIQHGTGGVVNLGGFAVISNNTITHCEYGIYFERTAYSPQIVNNTISSNGYGICLPVNSYNAAFCNNKVIENNYGISIDPFEGYARDTIISENVITNNRIGIELWSSDSGTIIGNYIANNTDYGMDVNYCTNNEIYHNNFINNGVQAHSWAHNSQNFWDDGYPSGGNYWSDYGGVDVKKGSGQDLHGSDGIGDTPNIIDADNVDHYPLMNPYGAPPPPAYALTITTTAGGKTDPAPGTYTYTANSMVQVTAIPNANYLFDYWELDSVNVGSANSYTVAMNKNHTVKAIFSHVKPSVPVGGYSFQIGVQTTANPSNIYVATLTILTAVFTIFKRKASNKTTKKKQRKLN